MRMFRINGKLIGKLDHVGSIVPDAHASAKRAEEELGVGPWGLDSGTGGEGVTLYHGEPEKMSFDIAFTRMGDICFELISPVKGRSCQKDFLDSTGGGIQHFGVMCTDKQTLDETVKFLRDHGYEELHAVHGAGPTGEGDAYYFDLRPTLGAIFEFMGPIDLALQPEARRAFVE
jgi:catechol 2,3-dioxygenase-like lactoylglutathione lyase family enzyme